MEISTLEITPTTPIDALELLLAIPSLKPINLLFAEPSKLRFTLPQITSLMTKVVESGKASFVRSLTILLTVPDLLGFTNLESLKVDRWGRPDAWALEAMATQLPRLWCLTINAKDSYFPLIVTSHDRVPPPPPSAPLKPLAKLKISGHSSIAIYALDLFRSMSDIDLHLSMSLIPMRFRHLLQTVSSGSPDLENLRIQVLHLGTSNSGELYVSRNHCLTAADIMQLTANVSLKRLLLYHPLPLQLGVVAFRNLLERLPRMEELALMPGPDFCPAKFYAERTHVHHYAIPALQVFRVLSDLARSGSRPVHLRSLGLFMEFKFTRREANRVWEYRLPYEERLETLDVGNSRMPTGHDGRVFRSLIGFCTRNCVIYRDESTNDPDCKYPKDCLHADKYHRGSWWKVMKRSKFYRERFRV